ncbi:MAG: hypothetical protein ACRDUX_23215 [Mycobacterium sp.]
MVQTLIRLAAGLGIVAAISVVGGLGSAVTSADPGGPKSPSSHSRDGGHSRGNGDGHRGNGRGSQDRDRGGDHRRDGSGRSGARGPSGDDGPLPTVVSPTVVAGRGTSAVTVGQTATASRLAAVEPSTSGVVPDAPIIRVATSGGGSGGGGQVATPIVAPRVTFGDGRSPRFSSGRPDDLPSPVVVEVPIVQPAPVVPALPPGAPPAPAPTPAPAAVARTEWLPVTPVTVLWGKVQPDWSAGVFFGIAGLLLAPIGGIWLGHRHARASRSATELVDS